MSKKTIRLTCLTLTILIFISTSLFPHNKLIIPDRLKEAVLYEISGLKALDYITNLCIFDRSGASKGLHESQKWIFDKLKTWGIKDIELKPFPADGEKIYLDTNLAGYAWEKKSAVLTLIEPYKKKIIDYAEVPTALVKYSNSADVIAEVVDVRAGLQDEDYAGKDVKSKIVFTSGNSYNVYPLAIKKYGALGIISSWKNYEPDRSQYPDQVPWMAIPQEMDTNYFGFSVSRNIADEMQELLSKGKVVVHAKVEAEVKKGNYYILSSSIQGEEIPEKEILLMAHVNHYKPGANDNASGSALLMEIERAIKALIDRDKMPPPKRTIRFLWIQEHTGSKIYVDSRPDLDKKGVIAINLDMVGQDILQCESSVRLVLTPHSCPSFLNDLVNNIMDHVSRTNFVEYRGTKIPFTYVLEKYNGGISDHYWYVSEGVSIPTSFLFVWPDNYYHSNEDTPDKCDPTMLKRLGFVSMATALYVASAGEKEAIDLSFLVYSEGSKRIIQAAKEGLDFMNIMRKKDLYADYKEAIIKLEKISEKEEKTVRSVSRLSKTKRVMENVRKHLKAMKKIEEVQKNYIEDYYKYLCLQSGQNPKKITLTDEEKKYARIIPQRHFRGPLNLRYIKKKISQEKSKWYEDAARRIPDFFVVKDEISNFINNKNSILDIRNAVSAEFAPIKLEDVFNFIDGIREAGFVTFIKK